MGDNNVPCASAPVGAEPASRAAHRAEFFYAIRLQENLVRLVGWEDVLLGFNMHGQTDIPEGGGNVHQVALGYVHICAIAGELLDCWTVGAGSMKPKCQVGLCYMPRWSGVTWHTLVRLVEVGGCTAGGLTCMGRLMCQGSWIKVRIIKLK